MFIRYKVAHEDYKRRKDTITHQYWVKRVPHSKRGTIQNPRSLYLWTWAYNRTDSLFNKQNKHIRNPNVVAFTIYEKLSSVQNHSVKFYIYINRCMCLCVFFRMQLTPSINRCIFDFSSPSSPSLLLFIVVFSFSFPEKWILHI